MSLIWILPFFLPLLTLTLTLAEEENSYDRCGGKYGNGVSCGHSVRLFCNGTFVCGGALVFPIQCWTARHCLENVTDVNKECKVRVGWNHLEFEDFSIVSYQEPNDLTVDIIVLELEEGLRFLNVPKLRLPGKDMDTSFQAMQRKELKFCGWGKISERGLLPNVTKIMPITMLDDSTDKYCGLEGSYEVKYPLRVDAFFLGPQPPTSFCAGVNGVESGVICEGDSGSGLFVQVGDRKVLVAVLSLGFERNCSPLSCLVDMNGNVWVNVSHVMDNFPSLGVEVMGVKNGGHDMERQGIALLLIATLVAKMM